MMKSLKKALALVMTAAMSLSMLTVPAIAEEPAYKYMVLHYDNFTLPNDSNWGIDTGNYTYRIPGLKALKMNGGNTDSKATTKIYIDTPGDYNVWIMNTARTADPSRYPVFGIDGEFDKATFYVEGERFDWRKGNGPLEDGTCWTLTEGTHEITLKASGSWKWCNVLAILITNDLDFVPTVDNDDALVAAYSDTTAPTISGSPLTVTYTDAANATITFGAATDANGMGECNYYIDGEKVTPDSNNQIVLSNLKPLDVKKVKFEAYDTYGNAVIADEEYVSSPVGISNFKIINAADGSEVTDISDLSAGDTIKVMPVATNRVSLPKTLRVSLTLYSEGYKRILANDTKTTAVAGLAPNRALNAPSITLPADFSAATMKIGATLWDNISFEPYIAGIELEAIVNE